MRSFGPNILVLVTENWLASALLTVDEARSDVVVGTPVTCH